MYEDEIITLQVGNFANYVGSHLKNIQDDLTLSDDELTSNALSSRCVMVDMFENIGNYPSEVQNTSGYSADWNGKVSKSEVQQGSGDSWTDLVKSNLHHKSLVQLPKWVTAKNFDTFHKGKNSDVIPEELIEDILDRLRYFAEGCNHVSAVQCFVDLQQGFGGIGATLLENIKDHIGNVCIPVFAFSETEAASQSCDIISNVKSLNVPLSYQSMMEHASVFVPLECHQSITALLGSNQRSHQQLSRSALIAALAIESATLFDIRTSKKTSELHTVFDWVHSVTQGRRFPLSILEAYFSPLDCAEGCSSSQELDWIVKQITDSTTVTAARPRTANPFMHSLSSADFGSHSFTGTPEGPVSVFQHRPTSAAALPFSNVVSAMGDYPIDFLDLLQSRTKHTPFRMSRGTGCSSPLYLPTSQFTSVFGPLSFQRQQLQQDYQSVSVVAAVGASERVGGYLRRVAAGWSEGAEISKVQLQKVGLMSDEVSEITEQMLTYSQAYSSGSGDADDDAN